MKRFGTSAKRLAAAAFGLLLPLGVAPSEAEAQTITNVAEANWTFGERQFDTVSNEVVLSVAEPVPFVTTYRRSSDGSPINFSTSRCSAGGTSRAASATPPTSVATLAETGTFRAGEELFFEIHLAIANESGSAIDSVEVSIDTGIDNEKVTAFETGLDTGRFVGSIPTRRIPPEAVQGDCIVSADDDTSATISVVGRDGSTTLVETVIDIGTDPFGLVFDSETGSAISGAVVTLIDASTGRPASVFAADGRTPWPSSMVSGETVTDSNGNVFQLAAGEYWFPYIAPGLYRLEVEAPAPFTAPSAASMSQIAQLSRPDGRSFEISDASFGRAFEFANFVGISVDIPLDSAGAGVALTKAASRAEAQPGDAIFYTLTVRNPDPARAKREVVLTDTPSQWLRLSPDSVRVNGAAAPNAVSFAEDGREFRIDLGTIEAGTTHRVTYAMTVVPDAPPGDALNELVATDALGRDTRTNAVVSIERDVIAGRMTIVGRVTAGDCSLQDNRLGIPGVRVMLEDGSFAITDADGRYHFEGVVPGTHVVQASRMTLPEGSAFVDCHRSTRSAGSASSRFVDGAGGSLVIADFHATLSDGVAEAAYEAKLRKIEKDKGGALADTSDNDGSKIDWFALGDGPNGWLFPEENHNPRSPAIRVAVRHRPDERVVLMANGKKVDPLAYDGTSTSPDGAFAVSLWRSVSLHGERTQLRAEIVDAEGRTIDSFTRDVYFTTAPAHVELVPELSNLIADGRTRPTVAVRILDRNKRPLREGVYGELNLSAPYQSAEQIDRQQLNQLTGLNASTTRWVVEGNDGVALIELAPTMVSGSLDLGFRFDDGEIVREQRLETWIEPGDIEWTVIGLAEGSVGARSVAENMERAGRFDSDLGDNARVALYAKGRVLGKYLVTLAYDSAKQKEDQRLRGTLDPDAYYTVFGDASSRRFDAASREKLYLRVESATFYALYGDFETEFNATRLARYNRTATGVKGEVRLGEVQAEAFAAEISTGFRRDEIQGQGITGPYRLSSRDIVANSEQVSLQVRDRFRSEIIVSEEKLERFLDYDVDLLSGTITFKQPVLSRDFDLNPQFIVVEYETIGRSGGEFNGGARAEWTDTADTVRVGASLVSDKGTGARTTIAGLDMRTQLTENTRLDAEVAISTKDGEMAHGWLVEAHHQTGKVDLIAYARTMDDAFGVGQQNGVELGRTKIGADARIRLSENFTILGSLWQDDSVSDTSQRNAAKIEMGFSDPVGDYRLALAHFSDRLADGSRNRSTVLEGGATRRLLDSKLEIGYSTSIALDDAASADLPARHRIDARYALNESVRLVGLYEIAIGENVNARTLKGGFEVSPWQGASATTSIGKQRIDEFGNRSYAAFGLSQTLAVSSHVSIDATIDGNRTIDAEPEVTDLVNPGQPLASGGQLGSGGALFEEFTAITLGGAYRKDRWSATARGEYRDGQFANRKGLTLGGIRQLGEGSIVGSGLTWTRADGADDASTEILDAAIALAHRPDDSSFAFLGKLEYRSDAVSNAVAGETGAAGRTALAVTGDALSRRLIASGSANWSPNEIEDGSITRRNEYGLFVGLRYNFDEIEGYNLGGTTLLAGTDLRFGISERFDVGGRGTLRASLRAGATSFSLGPNFSFVPTEGALLTIGYNIAGFRDEDFSGARNTDEGLYASVRLKVDAETFAFLGLDR